MKRTLLEKKKENKKGWSNAVVVAVVQWHMFSAVSVAGALHACAFAVRLPRDNGDGVCEEDFFCGCKGRGSTMSA